MNMKQAFWEQLKNMNIIIISIMLMNMYNKNHSLSELIKKSNEDIEFIYKLLIELVEHGYLFLSIKASESDAFFVFEADINKE